MPYLGSTPNASFSSRTKQDFTANGSTTAFTLSSAVASANDIEVFVGNVRQEPTDAYTVNGTTLTMSEAPATGLNFYVVFKGLEENSVVPADNTISTAKIQNNAITGAKLDATVDYYRAGTSEFMIGSDNGGTAQLTFYEANTSTKEGFLKYDGLNNKVVLGTSGASDAMEIARDTGYITKPNQVSFFAGWTTNSNAGGYGSVQYAAGFGRVGWNIGSGWDSAGTFTAPVAGKYLIYLALSFSSGAYNMHVGFYINGGGGTTAQGNSNGDPWLQTGRGNEGSSDQDHVLQSRIYNLNANDTLKPVYLIFDTDNNSQIYQNRSFVGGYLLG